MDRVLSPQDSRASSISSFENMITILVLYITINIIPSQMKCLLKMSVKDLSRVCKMLNKLMYAFWLLVLSILKNFLFVFPRFQFLGNNISAFNLP